MTEGNEQEGTGFGIAPFIRDNEHKIIDIDPSTMTISFTSEDGRVVHNSWLFSRYIEMDDADVLNAYEGPAF